MKKLANPKPGIYVTEIGFNIVILRDQDGPYLCADGSGYASLYTFENEKGVHPKTVIEHPFRAKRIGGIEDLQRNKK